MARITLRRSGGEPSAPRIIETSPAISLLNRLLAEGLAIPHDCGGRAKCGTCRLRVLAGGEGLSGMRDAEAERLKTLGAGPAERLACQTYAVHDVEFEIVGRRAGERP